MDRVWAIAVAYLDDGRLLLTRGETVELLDEAGEVLRTYPLPGYGWAMIQPSHDESAFFACSRPVSITSILNNSLMIK